MAEPSSSTLHNFLKNKLWSDLLKTHFGLGFMYASILEHLQNFVHDRCIQEMFVEMESFGLFIIIHYNMANN